MLLCPCVCFPPESLDIDMEQQKKKSICNALCLWKVLETIHQINVNPSLQTVCVATDLHLKFITSKTPNLFKESYQRMC